MYLKYLNDPNFFELLYKIDMDAAKEYRNSPCPKCGKALHYANYWRKARHVDDSYLLRFSVCCSSCRARVKIPSTIFFNSFVYGAAFFFVVSCLSNSGGHCYSKLSTRFKVSDRTLRRWKKWWDTTFLGSSFWKEHKGLLFKPPDLIPLEIVQRFATFTDVLKLFRHFNCRPPDSRNKC